MDLRRKLLLLAHEAIAQQLGATPDVFEVRISTPDGAVVILHTSRPGEVSRGAEHDLSAAQRAVLGAFHDDDERLSTATIAKRTGYANSSRLRSVLAELCREPLRLLVNTEDGYRLVTVT